MATESIHDPFRPLCDICARRVVVIYTHPSWLQLLMQAHDTVSMIPDGAAMSRGLSGT
jgi:hypothetical protein